MRHHPTCECMDCLARDRRRDSTNQIATEQSEYDANLQTEARVYCPDCHAEQEHNGLIAWCKNWHVYKLKKDDPRYSET